MSQPTINNASNSGQTDRHARSENRARGSGTINSPSILNHNKISIQSVLSKEINNLHEIIDEVKKKLFDKCFNDKFPDHPKYSQILSSSNISSTLSGLANEIAGEANIKKLIALAVGTEIILAVDNEKVVNDIVLFSLGKKNNLKLVVDIDLGLKRCGVLPGKPALELAKKIIAMHQRFYGLMGYEGHLQRMDLSNENLLIRKEAMYRLSETKKLLLKNNIPVNIVSAGGTGTYAIAGSNEAITEVQAGNYLLMDTSYAPFAPDFKPSLSLLTSVISFTPGERFILNAGIKEISAERGMPSLKNVNGAVLKALHAEHGIVEIEDKLLNVNVGDNLELNVYYSDGTVNLHRLMYGVRNAIVEEIFEIG